MRESRVQRCGHRNLFFFLYFYGNHGQQTRSPILFRVGFMDIYNRQKSLNLSVPESATVIGCGGVGSWVALDLALVGVKKLVLIDPDTVEDTNLNRTPFKLQHINQPKVNSIAEIIYERRSDTEVIALQKKFEDLNSIEYDLVKNTEIIVDCRDSSEPLPEEISKKVKIIGGYDGFKVTIHINPNYQNIWGDEPTTYTITPSFLVPPQFLACLIVLYICLNLNLPEKIVNLDLSNLFSLLGASGH